MGKYIIFYWIFVICIVLVWKMGHAIAQAVSRRLPTAEAQVRVQVRSCGIFCGQSGIETGFLQVLRFACQFSFNRLLHNHHHHLSFGAGTISQTVAAVPSGLSPHPMRNSVTVPSMKSSINHLNYILYLYFAIWSGIAVLSTQLPKLKQ
jgi:hypothetical protein